MIRRNVCIFVALIAFACASTPSPLNRSSSQPDSKPTVQVASDNVTLSTVGDSAQAEALKAAVQSPRCTWNLNTAQPATDAEGGDRLIVTCTVKTDGTISRCHHLYGNAVAYEALLLTLATTTCVAGRKNGRAIDMAIRANFVLGPSQ